MSKEILLFVIVIFTGITLAVLNYPAQHEQIRRVELSGVENLKLTPFSPEGLHEDD